VPLPLVDRGERAAAAEERRLLLEQAGHGLDRGVGRAGGFLRFRQQDRPFGILRLLTDDAPEERDGIGGTILIQVEARQREIDREIGIAVAARDLERGDRFFGYAATSSPGLSGWRCSSSAE